MLKETRPLLVVFGTRPEAIKMAPVIRAFAATFPNVPVRVCVTGQHRHMLDQVLSTFRILPDWDLAVMEPNQDLTELSCKVLLGLRDVIRECKPRLVLVQGDTTTALCAALAAFYERVDSAHVEAGLRTEDRDHPWPEEMNRRLVSRLASFHFAPTTTAQLNLESEGIDPAIIATTGNTVIDALLYTVDLCRSDSEISAALVEQFAFLVPERRLILVTGHRRENFGAGLEAICGAVKQLAARRDVQVVYPVHLNPRVQDSVHKFLGGIENAHLISPLGYVQFVGLLDRAYLVITDSGGIQEEAPALGKPVLVTRETTERMEAVDAGVARIVGTEGAAIVEEARRLLDDATYYESMARTVNPFGDGHAAERIAREIAERWFGG
jgi:UDP-N-acetylglucosamine 2-epimerase (non-hydrolysing)